MGNTFRFSKIGLTVLIILIARFCKAVTLRQRRMVLKVDALTTLQ